MLSHEITSVVHRKKASKRIGKGGVRGKTCGRGHKGINNARFTKKYEVVNVSQLDRFEDGDIVGIEQLARIGLVDGIRSRVKILGEGELTKRLHVAAHKFSKTAEQKIVACGGRAQMLGWVEAAKG